MNDKDLIADARAAMDYSDDTGWFWVGRLADALEARKPTEDDREALARVMDTLAYYHCRSTNPKADSPIMGYHAFSEDQREHLREKQREAAEEIVRMIPSLSRAAVPDAVAELRRGVTEWAKRFIPGDRWDTEDLRDLESALNGNVEANPDRRRARSASAEAELAQLMAERDAGKQAEADRVYLHQVGLKLGAERDAALAAVERVRAIHAPLSSLTWGAPEEFQVCEECNDPDARNFIYWPCPTVAALDGAPEPEWQYSWGVLNENGLLYAGVGLPRDQVIKVRRRPAGPWLPVEGESKP